MSVPSPEPPKDPGSESRSRREASVERVFAEFLEAHAGGNSPSMEALCAGHPEISADLRRCHEEWLAVERALGKGSLEPTATAGKKSLSDQIFETLGEGVDPQIRLDSDDGPVQAGEDWSRFDKLKEDGPRMTRYRMRGKIAQGGQGVVLKAWDEDLRRTVAIKVMLSGAGAANLQDSTDPRQKARLSRFLEEAQVTAQLNHPGIIPVHELGVDEDGRVFFTMQHVRGDHFGVIIEKARAGVDGWSITRALSILLRTCEAITFAHSKEVIHRDLKPANLMVGKYGEAYVMDWGLARLMGRDDPVRPLMPPATTAATVSFIQTDRLKVAAMSPNSPMLTVDGMALGTPSYMSLEQAQGQLEKMGPHTDVYSMGAILYQLLTGEVPYVAPGSRLSPEIIVARVCQGPPTPVNELDPKVAPELQAICDKAMARSIQDRYRSMDALAADIRAFLENRVVQAYQTGAVAELTKWSRRNKVAATIIAGLVGVAVLGGLGFGWWKQRAAVEIAAERDLKAAALSEKASALGEILRLSDAKRAEDLLNESVQAWPFHEDMIAQWDSWLRRSEDLLGRRADHQKALDALTNTSGGEVAGMEPEWRAEVLRRLLVALDLLDKEGGAIDRITRRRELTLLIDQKAANREQVWKDAIESISDPEKSPLYAGLVIKPQHWLVPLGQNPRTGLWEFWHVASGDAPHLDVDGQVVPDTGMGVVLILIPGGEFWMGGQSDRPDEPAFDPEYAAANQVAPAHRVTLDPYFIAKYEMTRAQWRRVAMMSQVDSFPVGTEEEELWSMAQINWTTVRQGLAPVGLTLPTEAQWERAAKGGGDGPWSFGDDPALLSRHGNYADLSRKGTHSVRPGDFDPTANDGFAAQAPVGSFLANPYGLHDVHGNVAEWCLDPREDYGTAPMSGSGLRSGPSSQRVFRGGSFATRELTTRSWFRNSVDAGSSGVNVGFRPARPVD